MTRPNEHAKTKATQRRPSAASSGSDQRTVPAKADASARVSPRSGVAPPARHRFEPGQSGNPAGRKRCGAYVKEWINSFQNASVDQLRRIIADPQSPPNKVTAAIRVLRACTMPDVAAFDPVLQGEMTLEELAATGVDVSCVRRYRRRRTRYGYSVLIEFEDRSGPEFDRIMKHTSR